MLSSSSGAAATGSYIVSTQVCREEADEERERVLRAVAQSFQLQ